MFRIAVILSYIFILTSDGVEAVGDTQVCVDGWANIADSGSSLFCVKLFPGPKSWTEASDVCRSEHSSLLRLDEHILSPTSLSQSSFHQLQSWLANRGVSEFWTALHVSGHRLWWYHVQPTPFTRNDETFSQVWRFALRQPNLSHDRTCAKATVRLNDSPAELSMEQCTTRLPFMCVNHGLSLHTQPGGECEEEWSGSTHTDHCLRISRNTVTYSEAEHLCASMGSHLAVVDTQYKQQLLLHFIQNSVSGSSSSLAATELQPSAPLQNQPTAPSILWPTASLDDQPPAANVMPGMIGNSETEDGRSGTASISNDTEIPAVWIGLTVTDGNPVWVNGAEFDANLSHFVATNWRERSGCVVMSPDHTGMFPMIWLVADCNQRFTAVCEKWKLPREEPQIIHSPEDIKTVSRVIPLSNIEDMGGALSMTCDVTGYVSPEQPIKWLKDGSYINNVLQPDGFTLFITMDLNEQMPGNYPGALQGRYQCQIWDSVTKRTKLSMPATLGFEDVLTYRGELLLPSSGRLLQLQHSLLTGTVDETVTLFTDMLTSLFTLSFDGVVLDCDVQLNYMRDERLFFAIYYSLPTLQQTDWDTVLDALQLRYYRDMPGETIDKFIDRMEEALLSEVLQHLETAQYDRRFLNDWHLANGGRDENTFRLALLTIRSTVACPEMFVNKDGVYYDFERTAPGKMASSKQVCQSDGVAFGKKACRGDFDGGMFWDETSWYTRCSPVAKSTVTDAMFTLAQDKASDTVAMATQLDVLTRQPDVLVSADVVCASHILMHLASSYMPSIQVAEKIVKCANHIMQARATHLEKAEVTDRASTRIVQALEVLSSMVDVESRPLVSLCQPHVCVQISNAETSENERDLGRGIVATVNEDDDHLSPEDVEMVPQEGIAETLPEHDAGNSSKASDSTEFMSGAGPLSSDIDAAFMLSDEVIAMMAESGAATRDYDYYAMDVPSDARDYSDYPAGETPPDFSASQPEMSSKDLERIFGLYLNHRMSRVTFSVYLKDSLFIGRDMERARGSAVNSRVVASTVNGYQLSSLSQPVRSVFRIIQNVSWDAHTCVWWDFAAEDGAGGWATEGCWLERVEHERIVCACNHLTNFAVLADMEQEKYSEDHNLALSIISMLGIILSLIGLTLTVLTFALFKKMRQYRSQKVLLNLALSLIGLNIVFLAGITRTQNWTACFVVSALTHYFLLSSFAWMLVEGVLQYLKFVKVFDTYVEKFMLKAGIPAWGGPVVIVVISIAVDWRQYRGSPDYCWVSLPVLYYAVLLPVGLIMVVNSALLTLVIKGMTCDRPKGLTSTQSRQALVWLRVKAVVCCFVLLGLTWLFAFIAINDARLVFHYIFCICNAFQGFFIFLCHILREKTWRTLWYNLVCCRKTSTLQYRSTVSSRLTRLSSNDSNKSQKSANLPNIILPERAKK